ncbi:SUEL-type lectin domain-containing protein [Plasmodiophora brassicae]
MWVYLDPWNQLLNQGGWPYLSLFTVRTVTTPSDDSRLPAVYLALPNRLHVSTGWAGSNYGAITPASVQAAGFGHWMFLAIVIDNTVSKPAHQLNLYYATNSTTNLMLLPGNTNGQSLPLNQSAVFSTDFRIQTALAVLHNVTLYDRALGAAELNQIKSATAPLSMSFRSGQPSYQADSNLAGGFAYEWLPNSPTVPESTPATNGTLSVSCPVGGSRIARILFASYGTPQGDFPLFMIGPVHANTSLAIVGQLCLNRTSCSVTADDTTFAPDPAPGVRKWLAVVVQCKGSAYSSAKMSSVTIRRGKRTATTSMRLVETNPLWRSTASHQAGRRKTSSRKSTLSTGNFAISTSVSRLATASNTARTMVNVRPTSAPARTGAGVSSGSESWSLPLSITMVALGGCAAGLILAIIIACCLKRWRHDPAVSTAQPLYTNPYQVPIAVHVPSPSLQYYSPASLDMSMSGPSSYAVPAPSQPQRPSTASMRRPRREEARDKFGQGAHTMTMSSGESTVEF